MELSAALLQA